LRKDAGLAGFVGVGRQYTDFAQPEVLAHLVSQTLASRTTSLGQRQLDMGSELLQERAREREAADSCSEAEQRRPSVHARQRHALARAAEPHYWAR